MNEADVIRAIETLNARSLELRSSREYADGTRMGNFKKLFSDISPAGFQRAIGEVRKFRAFSKAPRHAELANLDPEAWEASLRPGNPTKKVVIFTCVIGAYDAPLPPVYRADHITYRLYTDNADAMDTEGWEVCLLDESSPWMRDRSIANRYVKFHPHDLFAGEFDYSVYVDGNVQPVSDLSYYCELIDPQVGMCMHRHRVRDTIADEAIACEALGKGNAAAMRMQVEHYMAEGFPLQYGLLETNIIATDLTNTTARDILAELWDEMDRSGSGRDQLALPYILWKRGIPCNIVDTMGLNPYTDTKIFIQSHK